MLQGLHFLIPRVDKRVVFVILRSDDTLDVCILLLQNRLKLLTLLRYSCLFLSQSCIVLLFLLILQELFVEEAVIVVDVAALLLEFGHSFLQDDYLVSFLDQLLLFFYYQLVLFLHLVGVFLHLGLDRSQLLVYHS